MNISIFGLGYVGAVSMACLARDDNHVIGADIDPVKLELIRKGSSPVIESGMAELMRSPGRVGTAPIIIHLARHGKIIATGRERFWKRWAGVWKDRKAGPLMNRSITFEA